MACSLSPLKGLGGPVVPVDLKWGRRKEERRTYSHKTIVVVVNIVMVRNKNKIKETIKERWSNIKKTFAQSSPTDLQFVHGTPYE